MKRKYYDYIANLNEYKSMNLHRTGGVLKFMIGNEMYITYGKSIGGIITNIVSCLESNKSLNMRMHQAYAKFGDSGISVEILKIGEVEDLKQLAYQCIQSYNPTLNYKRKGGFSEEHRKHMSRSKTGEKHNLAKLSEKEAIQIKQLAIRSNLSSIEIGARYNISGQQVRKIKAGTAWAHIEE